MGVGIDAMKIIPQRLEPSLRKPVIAALKRCATKIKCEIEFSAASASKYDNLLVMAKKLSHYDAQGQARMVDVSSKARTAREAEASAFVVMTPEVLRALPENPKGDPLEVARTAGIMAAKRRAEGSPMWHPVALSHIAVTLRVCENGVSIAAKVKTTAEKGGVMGGMGEGQRAAR